MKKSVAAFRAEPVECAPTVGQNRARQAGSLLPLRSAEKISRDIVLSKHVAAPELFRKLRKPARRRHRARRKKWLCPRPAYISTMYVPTFFGTFLATPAKAKP